MPEGFVEATGSMAAAGGVDPDAHLVLDARIADAQRDGVREIADAPLVAERQPAAAEVGERLAAQVVAAQTTGPVDRVLGDAQRSWIGLGHDADGRQVAVPAGQVGEGTGQTNVVVARGEEVDGSLRCLAGVTRAADPVDRPGERRQRVDEDRAVARRGCDLDRPLGMLEGLVELVEHVQRVSQLVEHAGDVAGCERLVMVEQPTQHLGRLPVGAEADRVVDRRRSVLHQQVGAVGAFGVVDDPRRIDRR